MSTTLETHTKKLRFVTATTLFDGHDASINIFRRLLQSSGGEVIHLGHNRSADEMVTAAIQEGAHAIAASSYQGGHMEFFKYIVDLLKKNNVEFIKVFGGGGGVIVPEEIRELETYGVTKIYSPEDGQRLGLKGIIDDMFRRTMEVDYGTLGDDWRERLGRTETLMVSRLISMAENGEVGRHAYDGIKEELRSMGRRVPVVGITGTGGSGKSTLEGEFLRRFFTLYPDKRVALCAIDPTKKKTGGALLGDRIRMNSLVNERVFMRSVATRESPVEVPLSIADVIDIFKSAAFDLIIVETPGIGQGDTNITGHVDFSVYVMTSDFGAPSQLEKIDMLDYADLIVINKFDHRNSMDALRDVRKQYRRNHEDFTTPDEELPVIGTVASVYTDPALDVFIERMIEGMRKKGLIDWEIPRSPHISFDKASSTGIIPTGREQYLAEIADSVRVYHRKTDEEVKKIKRLEAEAILKGENDGLSALTRLKSADSPLEADFVELIEKKREKDSPGRGITCRT